MNQRYQTTFTFRSRENADKFVSWLRRSAHDTDYGQPRYVDSRQIGSTEWFVEYSAESDFARGVATGIDLP